MADVSTSIIGVVVDRIAQINIVPKIWLLIGSFCSLIILASVAVNLGFFQIGLTQGMPTLATPQDILKFVLNSFGLDGGLLTGVEGWLTLPGPSAIVRLIQK